MSYFSEERGDQGTPFEGMRYFKVNDDLKELIQIMGMSVSENSEWRSYPVDPVGRVWIGSACFSIPGWKAESFKNLSDSQISDMFYPVLLNRYEQDQYEKKNMLWAQKAKEALAQILPNFFVEYEFDQKLPNGANFKYTLAYQINFQFAYELWQGQWLYGERDLEVLTQLALSKKKEVESLTSKLQKDSENCKQWLQLIEAYKERKKNKKVTTKKFLAEVKEAKAKLKDQNPFLFYKYAG